jgi:hypothetical protein
MKIKSRIYYSISLWKYIVLLALFMVSAQTKVNAKQGGDLGMGFVGGVPTGVSGKLWLGETNALDFILGMNFLEDWVSLNADYVWHDFSLFEVPQGQLPLYYGMGPWATIATHAAIGIRGVVGIEYLFANAPLDAFFEICPSISVLPGTSFTVDAGLGMRFFF